MKKHKLIHGHTAIKHNVMTDPGPADRDYSGQPDYEAVPQFPFGGRLPQFRKRFDEGGLSNDANPYQWPQASGYGYTADVVNPDLASTPTGSMPGASAIGTAANFGAGIIDATKTPGKINMGKDIASGALKGFGTGASIGATLGSVVPVLGNGVGAVVGGAVGAAAGEVSGFFKGKQDQRTLRDAQNAKDTLNKVNQSINRSAVPTNVNDPTYQFGMGGNYYNDYLYPFFPPDYKDKMAMGGTFKVNSAQQLYKGTVRSPYLLEGKRIQQPSDSAPLTEYHGNSHENGGIPVGQGSEVEGKETRFGDYIYSDRLTLPNSKQTFASKSKSIVNKYKGRENDKYATTAKTAELRRLSQQNDAAKQQEEQMQQYQQQMNTPNPGNPLTHCYGGRLAMGGTMTPQDSTRDYREMDLAHGGHLQIQKHGKAGKQPKINPAQLAMLMQMQQAQQGQQSQGQPQQQQMQMQSQQPQPQMNPQQMIQKHGIGGYLKYYDERYPAPVDTYATGGQLPGSLAEDQGPYQNMFQYGSGGKIHINPKNKGKFTATKKATGKSTEELSHSSNPLTRKRAQFALNARHFKHALGGELQYPNGGTLGNDDSLENVMYTPFMSPYANLNYQTSAWSDAGNTFGMNPSANMLAAPDDSMETYRANQNATTTEKFTGVNNYDPVTSFAPPYNPYAGLFNDAKRPTDISSNGVSPKKDFTTSDFMAKPWMYGMTGAGALTNIGFGLFGKDKVNFPRVGNFTYNPEQLDYSQAINEARRQGDLGSSQLKGYVNANSSGSGNTLANYQAGIGSLRGSTGATVSNLMMQQNLGNVGINNTAKAANAASMYNTSAANAQIGMNESIARQQEKDARKSAISTGMNQLSTGFGQYANDLASAKTQAQELPLINQPNYFYYKGKNNSIQHGYDPSGNRGVPGQQGYIDANGNFVSTGAYGGRIKVRRSQAV